jgi:acyl carrier protein
MMDAKAAIRQFIVGSFFVQDADALKDEDPLLETGIIDSTGVLEVIHFIEDNYAVHLEDEEILPENLGSIERIAAFVERKAAAGRTARGLSELSAQR